MGLRYIDRKEEIGRILLSLYAEMKVACEAEDVEIDNIRPLVRLGGKIASYIREYDEIVNDESKKLPREQI